jgi:hypothetical protein
VRVRPGRDRRAPYRFTTTGAITPPAGVPRSAACRGRATVRVKAGPTTISSRQAPVAGDCRFRSQVTFRAPRRFAGRRLLHVLVRFDGNVVLARRTAPPVPVRVR